MTPLDYVTSWQLRIFVILSIVAWITQVARIIELIATKYKLFGPSYLGRASSCVSLMLWHVIDIVIACFILTGSQFLQDFWVCSFTGFFIADSLEMAYH